MLCIFLFCVACCVVDGECGCEGEYRCYWVTPGVVSCGYHPFYHGDGGEVCGEDE